MGRRSEELGGGDQRGGRAAVWKQETLFPEPHVLRRAGHLRPPWAPGFLRVRVPRDGDLPPESQVLGCHVQRWTPLLRPLPGQRTPSSTAESARLPAVQCRPLPLRWAVGQPRCLADPRKPPAAAPA